MQTILEKRKQRVQKLTQLALSDRNPLKYIQGRHILFLIENRIQSVEMERINFLNNLKN